MAARENIQLIITTAEFTTRLCAAAAALVRLQCGLTAVNEKMNLSENVIKCQTFQSFELHNFC